jgi:hypothetical protein
LSYNFKKALNGHCKAVLTTDRFVSLALDPDLQPLETGCVRRLGPGAGRVDYQVALRGTRALSASSTACMT